MQQNNVQIGQIWFDKDKRRRGRTFIINNIHNGKAYCETLNHPLFAITKKTKIKIKRFKSHYTLKPNFVSNKMQKLLNECKNHLPGKWYITNNSAVLFINNHIKIMVKILACNLYADCYIGDKLVNSISHNTMTQMFADVFNFYNDICSNIKQTFLNE